MSSVAIQRCLSVTPTVFVPVIACLAVVVNLATLALQLFPDDYAQLLTISLRSLHAPVVNARAGYTWWETFGVPAVRGRGPAITALIAEGRLPWWTSPSYSLAFFRPLAVALHYFDARALGGDPTLMHAHSVLWYALLVCLVALVHRQLGASTVSASLATLLYALACQHTENIARISDRSSLLCASACLAALLAHDHARRALDPSSRAARVAVWFSPLWTALGLCAGEGGLAVWGFLLSHAIALDRAPVSERVRALVPHFVATAVWFCVYRVRGYGAYGSGLYVDPLIQPFAYLAHLPTRLAILMLELFSVPAVGYRALSSASANAVRVASLLLSVTCVAYFVCSARRDRHVAFWLLSTVTTALLFCCAPASARLALTPGIAAAALLALPIARALGADGASTATPLFRLPEAAPRALERLVRYLPRAQLLVAVLATLLVLMHIAGAALWIPAQVRQLVASAKQPPELAASVPVPPAIAPDKTVFVLNTPSYRLTASAPLSRERGPELGPFFVLGSSPHVVTVTRVSEHSLEIAPEFGYLDEASAALVRDPKRRFTQGETHQIGPARLRVTELTPNGRAARLEIELEKPDDPRLVWTYWDGGRAGYRAVTLPPLGTAVRLPMETPALAESRVWF